MDTNRITDSLIQFSTYVPPIDLTFNQYLLCARHRLLVHTGNAQSASDLVDALLAELGDETVDFVFLSHFESDECGGIAEVLSAFPSATVLCSAVTARQLTGFGLVESECLRVCAAGEIIDLGGAELELVAYPSEMHLWEGLVAFERGSGIFFSSDLMLRLGLTASPVVDGDWAAEIESIRPQQVPDPTALAKLQETLSTLPVALVAAGHGPVLSTMR